MGKSKCRTVSPRRGTGTDRYLCILYPRATGGFVLLASEQHTYYTAGTKWNDYNIVAPTDLNIEVGLD